MRWESVPVPNAVAARPRDGRGFPVPAVTPWEGEEPRFALTDFARSAACARGRLCSVCGRGMPPGPVWRVVGAGEAAAMGEALAAGLPYRNLAPTLEAPGHRACMLYASMVCPYLARPRARRGLAAADPADAVSGHVARGAARGATGAVVGFAAYEYAATADQVLFRFLEVVEFLPHEDSAVHLDALRAELAGEEEGPGRQPR